MKMKQYWLVVAIVGSLLAAACAGPASPPSAASPQAAGGAPAAAPTEWEQTVAAARREGKVVIMGPAGTESHDALVSGFQRKYPDIAVDMTGLTGTQHAARILNEQASGLYLSDLYVGGPGTVLRNLRPADAVIPIAPFLAGPDVGPAGAWRGGDFTFADNDGRYSLMFGIQAREAFMYQPGGISPSEFTSWRDLLDPKWRGRIVMHDPRVSGGGSGYAVLWYFADGLGPDFIRQLVANDLVVSREDTQIFDWIARGQYAIGIGASNTMLSDYLRRGIRIESLDATQLREGSYLTPGNGNVAVLANPPRPNAAKVYLNWLLSADGQTTWSRATSFSSLRRDVPTDHVLPHYVPKEGFPYMDAYSDTYAPRAQQVMAFMDTLLRR
jgi:iron(III) transport system substrate-binding protein